MLFMRFLTSEQSIIDLIDTVIRFLVSRQLKTDLIDVFYMVFGLRTIKNRFFPPDVI